MIVDQLTDKQVRALRPEASRYDCWDGQFSGGSFGVRVSAGGRKTFVLIFRNADGRQRRMSLGVYPAVSLSDARKSAKEALASALLGDDPAEEKQERRKAATFGEAFDLYMERHAKAKKRSWKNDQRMADHDLLPKWKHRPLADIARPDVMEVLDAVADRGAKVMANRVRALISKVFNFAIGRGLADANPVTHIPRPAKETRRQVVLKRHEIRALWKALDAAPQLTGATFKLRLLTAQRGGEIFSMRWADLDGDVWTIPAEVSKNGEAHRVPLSPQALKVIDSIRPTTGKFEYVFPSRSRKEGIGNRGCYATVLRRETGIEFKPHDLRRTAATYMEEELGVPRIVLVRILNHVDRSVTAIYARSDYFKEMRVALRKWGNFLDRILSDGKAQESGDNVVAFQKG